MDAQNMVLWGATAANSLIGITVIAIVLFGTPRRFEHMILCYFLVAAMTNGWAVVATELAQEPLLAWRMEVLATIAAVFIYAFYLMFAAANLRTPLLRPFRGPVGRAALAVGAVAVSAWVLLRPEAHFAPNGGTGPLFVETSTNVMFLRMLNVALIWALIGSIHAFLRAPRGTEVRKRARSYAIAFGVQDVLVTIGLVALGAETTMVAALGRILLAVGPAIGWLILARAMVREHLFDVDLRIKEGISRGTVGAAFLGVFFVATQLAENYLDQYGWIAGGVATGLLLFGIQPLQRFADRVADSALPRVRDTSEYRTVRKHEVYRAALESVWDDGHLSQKERIMLATLADQLGLTLKETVDVERQVSAVMTSKPVSALPAAPG